MSCSTPITTCESHCVISVSAATMNTDTDVSVAAVVVIIATDVMDITCISICRSNNETTNASPTTSICNRRDTTAAARAATVF